ncbi:mitochondrion protein [Coccidioides immitis RMSCC 3703]|uniref:Mitochondrion protein n=1 Tax=Coccidioides immitis RMSCC 3703 TaxID=454286 RepID=A0A0J8R4E7_COCIT|nr:mitochondrion protein [Coccidioides immitis RMSCC 3703]
MMFFARVINAIPTMEWLSLPDEVQKFGEMMKLQLDLRIEASNLSLFREHFKSRTTAWFPYPYVEYTTREVLVEEFAQGIPLTTFLKNGGGVYDREISREGLDAFLHMLLIDNFVHADLHPGNIMVRFYKPGQLDLSIRGHQLAPSTRHDARPDAPEKVLSRLATWEGNPEAWTRELEKIDAEGYRPQIIFIDTGLVTQLNSANRRNFLDLFRAIAEFDGYKAGHLMVERSRQPDAVLNPEIFALKMQHLVLGVKGRTFALGNVKIGDVLSEVLYLVRAHHVRLEGDFVNVVISILLLEGIGRSLDPDLDLFKSALPILRQLGSGTTLLKSVREGDTSMLRVWMGLEARSFLQASISSVEWCVKFIFFVVAIEETGSRERLLIPRWMAVPLICPERRRPLLATVLHSPSPDKIITSRREASVLLWGAQRGTKPRSPGNQLDDPSEILVELRSNQACYLTIPA